MRVRLIVVISYFIFISTVAMSQAFNPYQHAYQGWDGDKIKKASSFRAFLNKFSLTVGAGYGRTFYNHEVTSNVLETPGTLVMLDQFSFTPDSIRFSGVMNWLNAPTVYDGNETFGPNSPNRVLYADSADIKYGGNGYNIPVRATLHFDIQRFRIGGGIVYELHGIKELSPHGQGQYPYIPNFNSTKMFRYFFLLGGKVWNYKGWDYHVELEVGKVKYDNKYDKSLLQNGLYFNIGIPMEYEFSEYFWVFVRPAFDYKSYTMNITGTGSGVEMTSIQHNQPAFYITTGVRMKLPEIKRCPVASCRTQLKHVHGSQEFRGQPFYKEQNPKIGELFPELQQNKKKVKKGNVVN